MAEAARGHNHGRESRQVNHATVTGADIQIVGAAAIAHDGGQARDTHVDFEGRLTIGAGDTSGLSDHSIHVACTVGGGGVANAAYMGMAPNVTLVSYGFEYDGSGTFLYSNIY